MENNRGQLYTNENHRSFRSTQYVNLPLGSLENLQGSVVRWDTIDSRRMHDFHVQAQDFLLFTLQILIIVRETDFIAYSFCP